MFAKIGAVYLIQAINVLLCLRVATKEVKVVVLIGYFDQNL